MDSHSSNIFKIGQGRLVREMAGTFGKKWLMLLSLLILIAMIAGAVFGAVWFMVALLLLFVVVPMLLTFFYYYHGLRLECYVNAVAHSLQIDSDGLRATMVFRSPKPDDSDRYDVGWAEEEQLQEKLEERRREVLFPFNRIERIRLDSDDFKVMVGGESRGFIIVPVSAFDSEDDWLRFQNELRSRIPAAGRTGQ